VTSIVMNEQIMETKKDMSKLTDLLMNQVEVHTKDVMNKLEKLDNFVQDQGKELIDETYNEVKNIQFKIKDFQQVYNISENKFSPLWEKVNVKTCFDTIIEQAKHDVKGKYMDISLAIDKDVPETINCDLNKIKQVILNLFTQSVIGQTRGFVKFMISY
jgi:signal transduction histidine kinase